MSIPTCAVLCKFEDQTGDPVVGATVHAQLSSYEVFAGYVVPERTDGITDGTGQCTLNLWPNQLGSVESSYTITVYPLNSGKRLRVTAVVPNLVTANLHEISTLPPYPGKAEGQITIEAAQEAGETALAAMHTAQSAASAAAASQTAASASADAAADSSDAASASASAAQGHADAAQDAQTAAEAAKDSVDSTVAVLSGSGVGQGDDYIKSMPKGTGAVESTVRDRLNRGYVTPWDFGDITGVAANDTPLIETAAREALALKKDLYFPGADYGYSGDGVRAARVVAYGDGPYKTAINLSAGKYLFRSYNAGAEEVLSSFELHDLAVMGGAGTLQSLGSGANIWPSRVINNCRFENYTRCAIETNTIDGPYWKIRDSWFYAATVAGGGGDAIGLALSGLFDQSIIEGCDFARNRVAVKLGRGGINGCVRDNSFLQFEDGTGRVDIWLVLTDGTVNFGDGLLLDGNKFGNEFRNAFGLDYRVVAAEEGAGTSFGDKLPNYSVSAHRIGGTIIGRNKVYHRSDSKGGNTPFFFTTTAATYGIQISRDNLLGATGPSSLIAYMSKPATATDDRLMSIISRPSKTAAVDMQFASGYRVPVTITNVGTTATIAGLTAHGKRIGDKLRVVGADDAAFNGSFTFDSVTINGGTYTMLSTPAVAAGSGCWAEVENFNGVRRGELLTICSPEFTIALGVNAWAIVGPGGGSNTRTGKQWGWQWRGKSIVVRKARVVVTEGTIVGGDLVTLGIARDAIGVSDHTTIATVAAGTTSAESVNQLWDIRDGESLSFAVRGTPLAGNISGHVIFEYEECFI